MTYKRKLLLLLLLTGLPVFSFAQVNRLNITATNRLSFGRLNQTIALPVSKLQSLGKASLNKIHIKDAAGRQYVCQPVDTDGDYHADELIFQADFAPQQTRHFYAYIGEKHLYKPSQFKAYGRFNRKRFGDFAWENDRIIQRVYGKALETWKEEPLTSSAVDAWVKSTDKLVINNWYMTDHYHTNTGEGADMYTAGASRGVGGDGIWSNDKLWVSANYVHSQVFSNGPIRIMFRLNYDPYLANGNTVREDKIIALDAGQNLNHFKVTYHSNKEKNPVAAIGIEKTNLSVSEVRKGITPEREPMFIERAPSQFLKKDINTEQGWITTRQALAQGYLNCAIIVNPHSFVKVTEDKNNELVLVKVPDNHVVSYWVGNSWSKSDQFKDYDAWKTYIAHFAQGLRSPIEVTITE